MEDGLFPDQSQLPPLIFDIVHETGLNAMDPGETTWIAPWMLEVAESNEVVLKSSGVKRGKAPGGTVTVKLINDFDGIYLDATALSREDLQNFPKPNSREMSGVGDDNERIHVGGVLYPLITESEGLEAYTVERFNRGQLELRRQFSDYYKHAYGTSYTFAEGEIQKPNI